MFIENKFTWRPFCTVPLALACLCQGRTLIDCLIEFSLTNSRTATYY
jgi:hypothetical protein